MKIEATNVPHRGNSLTPKNWFHLVEGYTQRKLTHQTDKLPALSGLAHEYQRIHDDRYLAGIWEQHLVDGLLWRKDMTGDIVPGPESYRAPSWSWAAVNGAVEYVHDSTKTHDLAGKIRRDFPSVKIVDASAIPSGLDKMGHLKGGALRVRGILREVFFSEVGPLNRCFTYLESIDQSCKWLFYPDEDFKQLPRALQILYIKNGMGLALQANPLIDPTISMQEDHNLENKELYSYRRIGFANLLESPSKSTTGFWQRKEKKTEITIV
jgi:hypothetical protein